MPVAEYLGLGMMQTPLSGVTISDPLLFLFKLTSQHDDSVKYGRSCTMSITAVLERVVK